MVIITNDNSDTGDLELEPYSEDLSLEKLELYIELYDDVYSYCTHTAVEN